MAHRGSSTTELFPGADYTAEEVEFIKAMHEYQRVNKVRFPTFVEVLRVAESLGYRKAAEPRPVNTLSE